MISESHSWKVELRASAKSLGEFATRKRFDDRASVRLELTTLSGLYIVWKLAESGLLSDTILHAPLRLTAFPYRRPRDIDPSRDSIADRYDLEAGRPVEHDVLFLCHQMVNNHTFAPQWIEGDSTLAGLYLTSAHQKRIAVYLVKLDSLVDLFDRIGSETPQF